MTQEEKELLIKDLSARLPHKVKASYYGTDEEMECIDIIEGIIIDNNDTEIIIGQYGLSVEKVKPHLFPLSSMTEEQALELYKLFGIKLTDSIGWDYIKINEVTGITFFLRKGFDVETHLDKLIDWLLKNHFDFRGLIPKGLAIDATNLNIY